MKPIYHNQIARRSCGSIIILCCVLFAVIALAIIIAYSFCGLYFVHNRLDSSANEIALAGAKKINEKDRIGQMNNMMARCRQLVYSSKEEFEKTQKEFKELESFAEPLLTESRDSANKLEMERKNLTDAAKREALIAMQEQFDSIKSSYVMTLPWLRTSQLQMSLPEFGKLPGLESNVEELTAIDTLSDDDRRNGFVDQVAPKRAPGAPAMNGINLYKAESEYKLAGEMLTFKLSSLPAPVNGVIPPARVLRYQTVKPAVGSNEYAQPAVRVRLKLNVETGLGPQAKAVMESHGASITNGASEQI